MVDKIKNSKPVQKTNRTLHDAFVVIALMAVTASALGVVDKPDVHTAYGELPLWQIVAGTNLALVLIFVWSLVHKKEA